MKKLRYDRIEAADRRWRQAEEFRNLLACANIARGFHLVPGQKASDPWEGHMDRVVESVLIQGRALQAEAERERSLHAFLKDAQLGEAYRDAGEGLGMPERLRERRVTMSPVLGMPYGDS